MIDLLCALNRLPSSFLVEVIDQTCPLLAQRQWVRNMNAVIKSVVTIEGQQSLLLEQMSTSDWCTSAIASMILEVRGL